jgi:cytidylate kinase
MSLGCFRVITIAREYGSGGAAVAATLAERLQLELLDRKLIEKIAAAGRIAPELAERFDEHVDRWLDRIGRALRFGSFEAVSGVAESDLVDAKRLAAISSQIITEAAAVGRCVIVGRGAQCLLAGRTDVFHAFVYASRDERRRNLAARLGAGAHIEAAIDAVDQERAAYVREHFRRDWLDPHLYHLMVNADLGRAAAVEAICAALEKGVGGFA